MPFASMSGGLDRDNLSGIADDVITELSRDRALFVAAHHSDFTCRDRSVDLKQVGRDLGVHYVVQGSTRRDHDLDAISGGVLA